MADDQKNSEEITIEEEALNDVHVLACIKRFLSISEKGGVVNFTEEEAKLILGKLEEIENLKEH